MAAGSGGFSSAVSVGVGAAYSAIKSAGQAERVAVGSGKAKAAKSEGPDRAAAAAPPSTGSLKSREGDPMLIMDGPLAAEAPDSPLVFDKSSEARLGTLRPDTQAKARQHLGLLLEEGYDARIAELGGARTTAGQTSAQKNTAIAAQQGNSTHQWGAGYDIVIVEDGMPVPVGRGGSRTHDMWLRVQEIGKVDVGMNLGPKGDYGHFEMPNWRKLPNLQRYSGPQL